MLEYLPKIADTNQDVRSAILMTVTAFHKAPKGGLLADADVESVVKFMVALLQQYEEVKTNNSVTNYILCIYVYVFCLCCNLLS